MIRVDVHDAFLGRDAVVRETRNGGKFISFPICDNSFYGGEEHADWYDVMWFNYNENISKHLKKGSCVNFGGTTSSNIETGDDGVQRCRRRIYCDWLTFAGGGKKSDDTGNTTTNETHTTEPSKPVKPAANNEEMPKVTKKTPKAAPAPAVEENNEDDLPF